MFKNPFSFKGQIGRLEYIITFIIWIIYYIIAMTCEDNHILAISLFLLGIPIVWLLYSQGAKRCHDLGKSGWWQLIPFYCIVMMIMPSKTSYNQHKTIRDDNKKGYINTLNNIQYTYYQNTSTYNNNTQAKTQKKKKSFPIHDILLIILVLGIIAGAIYSEDNKEREESRAYKEREESRAYKEREEDIENAKADYYYLVELAKYDYRNDPEMLEKEINRLKRNYYDQTGLEIE